MADDRQASRLGRGLAALIGDDAAYAAGDATAQDGPGGHGVWEVPVEYLRPNPFQPRHMFRPEDLQDLTDSIRAKGILQPIVVRPVAGETNAYEIVAGERRWRAAQAAQLHQVPILVKELTDAESLEIAIIENVQRADLNSVEEASGYERLIDQFSYTQDQLSKIIGKSRSHVANTLRLLSLPASVKALIEEGKLTAGHARPLIGHAEAELLAHRIVAKGLSVREAEALTRKTAQKADRQSIGPGAAAAGRGPDKDADTRALEANISDALGLKVSIIYHGDKGGEVRVGYKTLEQLDEICRRLADHRPRASS